LLAEAREDAGDSTEYYSLTHGDLGPIHVHRTRNQWAIIDWAKLNKRPLWMEFFVEYLRYPQSQHYQRPAFWQWLRGDVEEHAIPSMLQKDIELYLTWLNRWQSADQGAADLRYQILLWLCTPLKQVRQTSVRASNTTKTSDAAGPNPTHTEQIASALHLR